VATGERRYTHYGDRPAVIAERGKGDAGMTCRVGGEGTRRE